MPGCFVRLLCVNIYRSTLLSTFLSVSSLECDRVCAAGADSIKYAGFELFISILNL